MTDISHKEVQSLEVLKILIQFFFNMHNELEETIDKELKNVGKTMYEHNENTNKEKL